MMSGEEWRAHWRECDAERDREQARMRRWFVALMVILCVKGALMLAVIVYATWSLLTRGYW